VTVEGRVVRGSSAGPVVAVTLRVEDQQVARATIPGELELVGDDGRALTIEITDATHTSDLDQRKRSGTWAKLSQDPHAARFGERAPGPHVRATLIHEPLEPGARVRVTGSIVQGSAAAPIRVRATTVAGVARAAEAKADGGSRSVPPVLRRAWAVLPMLLLGLAYWTYVLRWPEQLAHPNIDHMRRAIGVACTLHFGVWTAVLLGRPGAAFRQLPAFVDRTGEPLAGLGTHDLIIGLSAFLILAVGLVPSLAHLAEIAATGDVLVKNHKGVARVSSGSVHVVFAGLVALVGYFGLVRSEWTEARLARLFRAHGSDWQLGGGRLRAGKLTVQGGTAKSSDELEIEIENSDRVQVMTKGLVWGLVDVEPQPDPSASKGEANAKAKCLVAGPGAHVVLAGRLHDGPELRATGAESLLLLAGPRPDLLAAVERGLWTRRLVLAIPPVLVLVSLWLV
jgi:hypothetical protein